MRVGTGARRSSAGEPARRAPRAQGTPRRGRTQGAEKRGVAHRGASDRLAFLRGIQEIDAPTLLSRFRVPIVVAAVVLFVIISIYPPAQSLYRAWRDQGVRQETLDGLNASIEEYQGDIERLQSREGIEDEARKRGYVGEGEVGVTLEGVPEQTDDAAGDDDRELPWYVSLGDVVFQYEVG